MTINKSISNVNSNSYLPIMPLLALSLAGFITILTEALPAGLLPQISEGLNISEALTGQLVTIYAVGSLIAAIPMILATQSIRRRPLLLSAIAGFVIANTITTFSTTYSLTMGARFVAGVSAGLLWALLAGYAARMVPDALKGRAITIAMTGSPLALSLGVPVGTFLGNIVGWRVCFGIMSILALMLMLWIRIQVPDFVGKKSEKHLSLKNVFTIPGVRPVLFVVLTFILAHNILYTYIVPYLVMVGIADRTDLVLLIFGLFSILGICFIGMLIDRYLRVLTLASTSLFGLSALILGIADQIIPLVYVAIAAWGLAFGGAGSLFQTAIAKTAGEATDVAQSMLVTTWNLAIAGGGIIGGLLLDLIGVTAFSPTLLVLLAMALVVIWSAKTHGFS